MPGPGKLHLWKETYRLTPLLRNMRKLTELGLPEETIAFSLIRSKSLLEEFAAVWNPQPEEKTEAAEMLVELWAHCSSNCGPMRSPIEAFFAELLKAGLSASSMKESLGHSPIMIQATLALADEYPGEAWLQHLVHSYRVRVRQG